MELSTSIKSYFRTYRAFNLFMIALTQFIVSHFIVAFYDVGILILISTSTIAIALAGYWLNDIADIPIDKNNQKQGLIDESNKHVYKIASIILLVLGISIGLYLSYISLSKLFLGYIIAASSVVFYALFLSKYKVIGNILVSSLISLVVLICFYIEINHMAFSPKFYSYKVYAVWLYAIAAFSVSWLREVVKDIEDIEGDEQDGRVSLATLFGVSITKLLVSLVSLLHTAIIAIYVVPNFELDAFIVSLYLLLFLFIAVSVYSLIASKKKQFAYISLLLKIALFIGLCLPIFY